MTMGKVDYTTFFSYICIILTLYVGEEIKRFCENASLTFRKSQGKWMENKMVLESVDELSDVLHVRLTTHKIQLGAGMKGLRLLLIIARHSTQSGKNGFYGNEN